MEKSLVWRGAGVALAGALALSAYSTFVGETKEQQTDSYWIVALVVAAITAAVFTWVVGRSMSKTDQENSPAITGLVASILGVVTVAAFWSGLPVVLGFAGVLLGYEGRSRAEQGARRGGMALAALIVGIVAIAAGVAASVGEKVL